MVMAIAPRPQTAISAGRTVVVTSNQHQTAGTHRTGAQLRLDPNRVGRNLTYRPGTLVLDPQERKARPLGDPPRQQPGQRATGLEGLLVPINLGPSHGAQGPLPGSGIPGSRP